ncbi:MAG: DHH family phosphoesterase [Microgenomates group bacterium]
MDIKLKTKVEVDATAQDIFDTIMESRGYKTKVQIEEFLHPVAPDLDYLLHESGLKKSTLSTAKKFIDSHLVKNSDICVFGDYDADGVSSTAIMWQAITAYAKLQKSHSRILPFMPDRHKHGYGLGEKAVSEVIGGESFANSVIKDFRPKLIITVDTGIVAHDGIATFKSAGIDTIITDHHLPDANLPAANVIVHTTTTSGAGVAWIFAMYLLGEAAIRLIDLAAIGVVGDMMPLVGLNRSICVEGLYALSHTKRPGLVAMKEVMGIGSKELSTYDISFGIAPRINAAGRIYNPLDALRMLCTTDLQQAKELATKIEAHNKDRQEYTDNALKSATDLKTEHKVIVVIGDYHEGVIGLVAGKLAELYNKPAIVMSDNGEVIKGSARSVTGVSITGLLRSLKTPFLGLGGHDQAAGFSLGKKYLKAMMQEIETLADKTIKDELLIKSHFADLKLELNNTSLKLAKLISTMEPFGMHNQKPKFYLESLNVLEDKKLGAEGKHRKLTIEKNGVTRELMLFNTKEKYPLKQLSSVICTIDINVWRDKESLQLIASYVET